MANITITDVSGVLNSNDYTVPLGVTIVSFATDTDCVVCFENSATFGVSSRSFFAQDPPADLTVMHRTPTNFLPILPGNPCNLFEATVSSPGVHTIGMGS